jgi:hypothetical protein
MLVLEPSPIYQTLRHKMAWVDTREKDIAQVQAFLAKKNYPVLNVGTFIAGELSSYQASEFPNLDIAQILTDKIRQEARVLEDWNQPIICLSNLGILLEPHLGLQAAHLLKDISKNIFLIILWEYFCDDPGIFHWGNQKQTFYLDFSGIGIKKIPFIDEI